LFSLDVVRALVTGLQVGSVVFAILGGVFLGLFSCGGYVWHKQAIVAAIVLLTLAALCVRVSMRGCALWRSVGFVALVVGCFFVSQATAAPFYPNAPASLSEFWQSFVRTLEYGPC
jgi:hypothetical protein